MSLRYQVLVRFLLSALGMLIFGGVAVIWQARQAVEKEVDSSVNLAVQLMSLGLLNPSSMFQLDDVSRLNRLQPTRHLSIVLQKPDGVRIDFPGQIMPSYPDRMPPRWFSALVSSDFPQVEHQIQMRDGQVVTLIIKPQPLDEIAEVWDESITFFCVITVLVLLSLVVVNLVFNRALRAIGVIVAALRNVEVEQYQSHLPQFGILEFDYIAKAVNRMMAELAKTQRANRLLMQHSLAIQEDERKRLAHDLHDEFGQSLTAIKVMAVAARLQPNECAKISLEIEKVCQHLLNLVRSMMQQLHPMALTDLGLKAALEDMVGLWAECNPELRLVLNCDDAVDVLDHVKGIQVFRVIQECLTNVVRHAQAGQVNIELKVSANPPTLMLSVSDNGVGCDVSAQTSGFGLSGLQERIKSLGGQCRVQSAALAGFSVKAQIPL